MTVVPDGQTVELCGALKVGFFHRIFRHLNETDAVITTAITTRAL